MKREPRSLADRIEAEQAAASARIRAIQSAAATAAQEMRQRRERFEEVAHHLMEVGGDPLTTLVQHFDNATLHRSRDRRGHTATCRFRHTPRFPASVTLTFEWGHDEEVRRVIVGSHLRILPVFIDFEHEDQIVYELDAVDESAIRRWVEDKIVSFVKVYLRIEVTDAYQRYNRVTDPVSGTRFPQTLAKAESEYQGHRYSFLSDETKLEFDADPERFVSTGRETGPRRVPVPSGRRAGRPATSRAGLG